MKEAHVFDDFPKGNRKTEQVRWLDDGRVRRACVLSHGEIPPMVRKHRFAAGLHTAQLFLVMKTRLDPACLPLFLSVSFLPGVASREVGDHVAEGYREQRRNRL